MFAANTSGVNAREAARASSEICGNSLKPPSPGSDRGPAVKAREGGWIEPQHSTIQLASHSSAKKKAARSWAAYLAGFAIHRIRREKACRTEL
jgi:hypothetical protein